MKPVVIVLIEDNPSDVLLFRVALAEAGIQCKLVHYETGEDALNAFREPGPLELNPDIILVDLHTPRTDGFDLLAQLQGMPFLSRVPIAVLTSSQGWRDQRRVQKLGISYLVKPMGLEEFKDCVGAAVKAMLQKREEAHA